MNKVIACLIAVVAALIVALVLLNRQLTPPTAPAPAVSSSQPSSAKLPDLPDIGGSREPAAAAPEVTGTGKTLPPLPDSLEIGAPGIHRAPISNTTVTDGEGAPAPSPTTDQASETASSGSVPAAGTQTDNASEPQQTSAGSEPAPSQMAPEEKTQTTDIPSKPEKAAQAVPAVQQKPHPAAAQASVQREKKDTAAKHEQLAQKVQKQPREKPVREQHAQAAKAEKPADRAAAGNDESAQNTRRTGRVTVLTRNGGATVRLSASDEITYKHMILTQPDRFVIDLNGRWDVSTDAIPSNPLVTNIRLGRFKNRTRVVIDMSSQPRNARANLSKNRCRLDVRVDR